MPLYEKVSAKLPAIPTNASPLNVATPELRFADGLLAE